MEYIDKLSKNQIEFLKSKGFERDHSKHSGFLFLVEDGKTYVLILQSNGEFFIEVYELLHDGDSSYYEDVYKIYANGQSLEEFIHTLGF